MIKLRRHKRLCRVSPEDIYKYLYELEIGLSNGDVIKVMAYSDYKYHSCESFIKNYKGIYDESLYYSLWHNGGRIKIIKKHISFERIKIIGERENGC